MSISARFRNSLTRYERILVLLFAVSLPFVNPWVRGDGVGYYAYIHALLIRGDLHFENEWLAGNTSFRMNLVDAQGRLKPYQYTRTGHIGNHFTVGPAVLWAPSLIVVHLAVLSLHGLGARVAADGYSWPYTLAMAVTTAVYGFLALVLAFRLARKYFEERWAFWATLGVWFASSLPVYMYLNPSWSHAHSAFTVSWFLWYWHRTRGGRAYRQWAALGALSGLMLNVYYPNAVFLLIPLWESLVQYRRAVSARPANWPTLRRVFAANVLYAVAVVIAFLPTLVTRQVIYGSPFASGYYPLRDWFWKTPALWDVLFSSNHGLFSWTPILVPAVVGLLWLRRQDRQGAAMLGVVCFVFYYLIASYPTWDGISSFGNRFFVSLTPVFVLGLSAFFEAGSGFFREGLASPAIPAVVTLFMAWNLAFIFQWGTKLIPNRGPISWREVARNQVVVVPAQLYGTGKAYFLRRKSLMETIEREDVRQILTTKPVQEVKKGK